MLFILVKRFHEQPINEVHMVSFTCSLAASVFPLAFFAESKTLL